MNKIWILSIGLLFFAGCENYESDDAAKESSQTKSSNAETDDQTMVAKNESLALNNEKPGASENVDEDPPVTKPNARTVLSDAIAAAKADDMALLVHFSADW